MTKQVNVKTSQIEITESIVRSLVKRGIPNSYHHRRLTDYDHKKIEPILKFIAKALVLFKRGGKVYNYTAKTTEDRHIYMTLVKTLYLNGCNILHLTAYKLMSYIEDGEQAELMQYDTLSIDDFYDTEELIKSVNPQTLYKYQGFLQDWLNDSGSIICYSSKPIPQMKGFGNNFRNTLTSCEIDL